VWRREHCPGSNKNDVRGGAQETHHETIGFALARDQGVRTPEFGDRHDAVDRLDEVGEEAGFVEAEPAAIEATQLQRQI
jgi:hypothetical protein